MPKDEKYNKFLLGNEDKPEIQKPQKTIIKQVGKMGRPSDKNPDIEYVKLSALVPFDLREKIKLAMLTTHKHLDHLTQDSFIQAAIEFYLEEKAE